MKALSIKHFLLIGSILFVAMGLNKSYSQDLVDDISSPISVGDSREMFTETIRIIGRSRRVFIITNTNQQLFKGDFITIVLGEKDAVARAVVAKLHNELVGIKILRIYSLSRWKRLKRNLDVKILKGDDSWLFVKESEKKDDVVEEEKKINSEEDLYNDELIDEDLDSFGKDNRLIKPDNIVSLAYSRYSIDNPFANDNQGEEQVYNMFSGAWAYQFADNTWIEGNIGRVTMNNVPDQQLQTVVTDFTVRLKYTFQAPLYSYFMPYIGYQIHSVDSPDAGTSGDAALDERELNFIDDLKRSDPVIGVTILRRLVPGWFLKVDLGTDVVDIGFGIEF